MYVVFVIRRKVMNIIDSLSSYVASMQQLQMSIIKQNQDVQQQMAEILLDASRSVPVESDKGVNVDITA